MALFQTLNIGLSFLLELAMVAAFGYWGFQASPNTIINIVLGIGTPLLAIIIWGIYNAPRSTHRLPRASRMMLELLMFGSAALALASAGQLTLAVIFFGVVLINLLLVFIWKQ